MKCWMPIVAMILTYCGYRPNTPLTRAVVDHNTQQVRNLLASGSVTPGDVQNALVAAARVGHTGVIPDLAKRGAGLEKQTGVNGWTPLQHAIHKNRLNSVRALIDAGANPNGRDAEGHTALMMAAGYGQTEIVRLLMEKSADAGKKSSDNLTALDMALTGVRDIDRWTHGECQTSTVKALLEKSPGLRPTRERSLPGSRCPDIDRLLRPDQRAGK